MKPEKKTTSGNVVSSKLDGNASLNESMTEVTGAESEILSQSTAHLTKPVLENKTEALLGNVQKSPCECGALVVSLNDTMLSHMDFMKEHMVKQTELFQEQKVLHREIKKSQDALHRDLHDSDGLLASSLAPIKFDLHDSRGHLATMLKESEARLLMAIKASEERAKESETRIISAIEASKEDMRKYTDTVVAENNVSLMKLAGKTIFAVATSLVAGAVVYAEWIVHRLSAK